MRCFLKTLSFFELSARSLVIVVLNTESEDIISNSDEKARSLNNRKKNFIAFFSDDKALHDQSS